MDASHAVQEDGRRARSDRTRRASLDKAVDIASAEGLQGLSMGALATDLGADLGPEQLAFELDALGVLANSLWQLQRDERAFERARVAMRGRLEAAATAAGRRALARVEA